MLKIRLLKDKIARQYMLGITVFCLLLLFIIGAKNTLGACWHQLLETL
jgi:hypothetical protein